ncbi:MAG: hypothetical protein L3V56_00920 [Candidatus Magnetoovum sp. WYHC-5]|nr:hypothetical protein [Candidatus Magnetoovum sp. WYHC-5]
MHVGIQKGAVILTIAKDIVASGNCPLPNGDSQEELDRFLAGFTRLVNVLSELHDNPARKYPF